MNPERSQVVILTLVEGFYEEAIFQGDAQLVSTLLPQLDLTAAQVLNPADANSVLP